MRGWRVCAALVLAAAAAAGEPGDGGRRRRPDVDVFVPVDPQPPETRWMHRDDRRLIPPTVSIGGTPYVCDVDALRFPTRDAFVAHLRGEHLVAPERLPDQLYQADGEVHFTGE